MRYKFIRFLCLILLVTTLPTQAYALETDNIPIEISTNPKWINTVSIAVELVIINGKAEMLGMVIGEEGTESITANAVLNRINIDGSLTKVSSWENISAKGDNWIWAKSYYVNKGYEYQLTLTATVYRNGYGETISKNSNVAMAY